MKAKESEIKGKVKEMKKCRKVKKKLKKRKELAILESELAGLKMEEEAIQVTVARHELLNAQLEQKRGPKVPQLSSSGSTGADTEEDTVSVQKVSTIYRILDVICGIH